LNQYRPLLKAIQLACDHRASPEQDTDMVKVNERDGKDSADSKSFFRGSELPNQSFIFSQNPHLPLGWASRNSDSDDHQLTEIESMRQDATIASLNDKYDHHS